MRLKIREGISWFRGFKDYDSMEKFNDNFNPEDIDTIRDYSLLQGIEIIGDLLIQILIFLAGKHIMKCIIQY